MPVMMAIQGQFRQEKTKALEARHRENSRSAHQALCLIDAVMV
jgi:hypothetical protein